MSHLLNVSIELIIRYLGRINWVWIIPLSLFLFGTFSFNLRYRNAFSICHRLIYALYFSFLTTATIFGRYKINTANELDFLKTYRAMFTGGNVFGIMEIIFNMLLFFPFGTFLSTIHKDFKNSLLIIALSSFIIEIIQFIFQIGTAELADLINNMLGGLIGYFLGKKIDSKFYAQKSP